MAWWKKAKRPIAWWKKIIVGCGICGRHIFGYRISYKPFGYSEEIKTHWYCAMREIALIAMYNELKKGKR